MLPICNICCHPSTGRPPGGQGEAQFLWVLPWLCLSNPGSSGVQEVQHCGASKFYLLINGLEIFTKRQVNVEYFGLNIGISRDSHCLVMNAENVDTLACVVLALSLMFSLSLFLTLLPSVPLSPFSLFNYDFSFSFYLSPFSSPLISQSLFLLPHSSLFLPLMLS